LCHCDFLRQQRCTAKISPDIQMTRVLPQHQGGARRRTNRTPRIEIRKTNAFSSQLVNVWRLDPGLAVASKVTVSKVIRKNQDNAGSARRWWACSSRRGRRVRGQFFGTTHRADQERNCCKAAGDQAKPIARRGTHIDPKSWETSTAQSNEIIEPNCLSIPELPTQATSEMSMSEQPKSGSTESAPPKSSTGGRRRRDRRGGRGRSRSTVRPTGKAETSTASETAPLVERVAALTEKVIAIEAPQVSAVSQAVNEVMQIIDSLRRVVEQMEEVLELVELAERQKLADEQEIESLRQALRQLQRPSSRRSTGEAAHHL